ncbi:MAG: hypothetical protein ACM3JB_17310 [Acidobacteriaceae bacterium]
MLMLRFRLRTGKIAFESVGINEATVFTGLCAKHDAELFKLIDTEPDLRNSREWLFLHAYRAVIRETHASIEAGVKVQLTYQKKCELGMLNRDIPTREGMLAVERLALAYETHEYKELWDTAFLQQNFLGVRHDVLDLGWTGPCIAVSSLFSLDEIVLRSGTPRVALNILPLPDGHSLAIFSYTRPETEAARSFLGPILNGNSSQQRYLLSRLVLERSDNIAFNPLLLEKLGTERQEAIRAFEEATVLQNQPDWDDERLNLFP